MISVSVHLGKYSGIRSIGDDADEQSQRRPSPACDATSKPTNSPPFADASQKLDEITPLLYQATISNNQKQINGSNTIDGGGDSLNSSIGKHNDSHYNRKGSSSSHQHGNVKLGYRKKSKKSNRKAAAYNLADSNLSDSDKN